MLFSPVFACTEPRSVSAEPPLLAPALSGSANQYLRRPSRPHHFPFLLFDFPVPPKLFRPLPPRAPKPRRIIDLQSLSKQRTLTSFTMIDLRKNRGVGSVMVNQTPDPRVSVPSPPRRRSRGTSPNFL